MRRRASFRSHQLVVGRSTPVTALGLFLVLLTFLTLLPVRADSTERRTFRPVACNGWFNAPAALQVDQTSHADFNRFNISNSAYRFSGITSIGAEALNTTSQDFSCDGWEVPVRGIASRIQNASLRLSLGAIGSAESEDVLGIQTSLDGKEWKSRDSIVVRNQISNQTNEGYFTFRLDDISSADQLRNLRVKVITSFGPDSKGTKIFLDAISVSADVVPEKKTKQSDLEPRDCVGWSNADNARRIEERPGATIKSFSDRSSALVERHIDSTALDASSSEQSAVVCSNFGVLKATSGRELVSGSLLFSLAAEAGSDATGVVVPEYSLDDGETWTSAAPIIISGQVSNNILGGYVRVELPAMLTRETLAPLSVRLRYDPGLTPGTSKILFDGVKLELYTIDGDKNDAETFGLSFLTKHSFLPLEDPVITIEEGELQSVEVVNANGQRVDLSYKVQTTDHGTKVNFERGYQIRPGTYTVKIKTKSGRRVVEETQTFTWGLTSINSSKDVYKVGERMPIAIGVVNETGRTICDADLTLRITRPDGSTSDFSTKRGSISVSKTCGPKSITAESDYLTYVTADQVGAYTFDLTAQTNSGPQTSQMKVAVESQPQVTVERVGPSRINPKQPYLMHLFVTPDQNYQGPFIEYAPPTFSLYDANHQGVITTNESNSVITWNVDWVKGHEYELTYTFDAPDVSPAMFRLGPARFGSYAEPRSWQIASDEIVQYLHSEFSFGSVAGSIHDWDPVQPQVMAATKPIYLQSEIPAIRVATNGFALAKNKPAVSLRDLVLRGPGGLESGFDVAIESFDRGTSHRDTFYARAANGFRPGVYTLSGKAVDGSTVSQSFEWGTIQLEVNNPEVFEKDLVDVSILTFGNDGGAVCPSKLEVYLSTPTGTKKALEDADGNLQACVNGRTIGQIRTTTIGSYTLEIRRQGDTGERYIVTSINAVERPVITDKVGGKIEKEVKLATLDVGGRENPHARVKVHDAATFGFLGVDATNRDIVGVSVVDPAGDLISIPLKRRDSTSGGTTEADLDIDTSNFKRAGKYSLLIDVLEGDAVRTVTKDFSWGVLALNVSHAVALPGNNQQIGMAVLDDFGRTICDADIEVQVIDPKNSKKKISTSKGSITKSGECVDKGVTNTADYLASIEVNREGEYRLIMTAKWDNQQHTVEERFRVDGKASFDVDRYDYPTRIYPVEPYPVQFAVTPREDLKGRVEEVLPANFTVRDISAKGKIEQLPDALRIAWDVDWKAGETHYLKYSFDAPDVSPALFLAGPLRIVRDGQEVFSENRQWQIASDSLATNSSGYAPSSSNLITGTNTTRLAATASVGSGVNTGNYLGALADDNLHWTVVGANANPNYNVQLNFDGIQLNGANKIIVQTELDTDGAVNLVVQICDWVSSTSVDNAADAQCTTGGWRTINTQNASNADVALSTIGTGAALQWHIYDGYFNTGSTGGTALSTPLTNFVSGSNQLKIRYFGATASSTAIDIDFLRVIPQVDPIYVASAFTQITGGTVAGTYMNTNVLGNSTTAQLATTTSDATYLAVPGTAGAISDFYLSYKNVQTYTGANTILVVADYSCSTTGINIKPKIYNFNSTAWEDLTATAIACSATDANGQWAKNNVTISNYISSGEIRVGWYGSANNTLSIRLDMQYVMIGTTNTDNTQCEITFGTGTATNCTNTRDLDVTGTTTAFTNAAADESNTYGTDYYALDNDGDATVEEASASNVNFAVTPPTGAQITNTHYAGRFSAGSPNTTTAMAIRMGIRDYAGVPTSTSGNGGWALVGATSTAAASGTTYAYTDSMTALAINTYGNMTNAEDRVDFVNNKMNIRLQTTASGTTTNNTTASWDFAMVSIAWINTTEHPQKQYQFVPTASAKVTGGTDPARLAATAAAATGVNTAVGTAGWKSTLADDNYHWTVVGANANPNLNAQLTVGGVQLNGANKMMIQTEFDMDAAMNLIVQICDWVSSTGVDNAADAQCTTGGWRTLNSQTTANADTTIGTFTNGVAFQWHIFDGYFSTGNPSGTPVSTPLTNFLSSGSNNVLVRYYSTTASATNIDIDFLRVIPVVDSIYYAASMTQITGGTVTGIYNNTHPIGNTSTAQQTIANANTAGDAVYLSVPGTAGAISDFYLSFKNVKLYSGMNTIYVRSEYSCSTTGINIKPKIYNFNTAAWEDLTTGTIACSATDAMGSWAKNNVTITNYIQNGEIRVGWYGSANNTLSIRIDDMFVMLGSTNSDSSLCQVSFGTGTATNCTNARDLDTTGTVNSWSNASEDESNTFGHDFIAMDSDADATAEEAESANMSVSVVLPGSAQAVGAHWVSRYDPGGAAAGNLSIQSMLQDYSGLPTSTAGVGGWDAVGSATAGVNGGAWTLQDSLTSFAANSYGVLDNPVENLDTANDRMNIRYRTTAAGTTTNNVTALWDFGMTSVMWVETTGVTISGNVYSDETPAFINCTTPKTVSVVINGGGKYSGSCTGASGSYSITNIPIPYASADVTVYLDGATEKAIAITEASNTTSNITNLHLYQNRVVLTHEDAGPITNDEIRLYDSGGDSDIQYAVAGAVAGPGITVSSGSELHVNASKTYTPGGAVTTNATGGDLHVLGTATIGVGTNTIGSDIIIPSGGTLNINANTTVSGGDITVTSTGALTTTSGTPTVTMGATGTIGGTGNVTFYNLATSGTGTTTFNASGTNTINNTISVGAATTLNINSSMSIANGLTNATSGVISTSAGTPTVTMTGATPSIGGGTTGAITIYALATSGTGTTTFSNGGTNTINNNVTVGTGTTLNINSSITVAGNLTNTTTGIIGTSSGTPTVTMTGTSASLGGGSGALTFYALAANGTNSTLTVNSDASVSNTLTVGGDANANTDVLSIASSKTLSTTGTTTLTDASDSISGSGTLRFTDTSSGPGTTGTLSSGVRFDASTANIANTTFDARTYGGAVELYSNAATGKSVSTAASGTYTFSSTLTVTTAGAGATTLDMDTTDPTSFTVTGTLTNGTGSIISATSSGTFNINGNYVNSGTFTHNSGTVTAAGSAVQQDWSGTLAGSTGKFNNLVVTNSNGNGTSTWSVTFAGNAETAATFTAVTASTKLRFNSGSTYTFQNLTLNGQASGTRVFMRASGGTAWLLVVAGTRSISYTDVKDSDASGTTQINAANGTNFDSTGNTNWLFISGITVSGGCFTDETEGTACTDDGADQIRVAVNGTLNSGIDTVVDGSWSLTVDPTPAAGDVLVFFRDGEVTESEEATTIVKYDGTGVIDQIKMYQSQLVLGTDTGSANTDQTISAADLNTGGNGYENSDDEDVLYDYTAGADITVDAEGTHTEKLYVINGDTYRPASGGGSDTTTQNLEIDASAVITADSNAFLVAGNWTNAGTFTANSSTVTFNGSSAQTVVTNGNAFNALTLNNTGASGTADDVTMSGALDVNGTLTITDGDLQLATNDPNVTTAGDVSIGASGLVTKADNGTATWTFDGTSAATWTDSSSTKQDLGLVTVNKTDTGAPATNDKVTLGSSVAATKVTIDGTGGQADTLDLANSSYVLTLTGSGQAGSKPLTVSGTLTVNTNSTVEYAGTAATDISRVTYANLSVKPGSAAVVHHAEGGGTFTVNGTLTVGNGSNTGTFNIDTNDPTLDVNGDVSIAASGTLTASGTNDMTVAGSWANSGTFTAASGRTVTFDSGSSGKTLSGTLSGSSAFQNIAFNNASGTWSINASLTASGTFAVSTGAVTHGANTTLTVSGTSFTLGSGTTWTKTSGTGKVLLDNATNLSFADNNSSKQNLGAVQIGASPATVTLTTDMSADTVTIPAGDTLNTKGYEVTTTGTFDCQSTCTLNLTDSAPSNEGDNTTLDVGGDFTMSTTATFTAATGTVFMNSTADSNRTFTTGGKTYNNVELKNAGATNDDITIVNSPLDVNGTLTLTDGQVRLDTNDPNVTTAGNVSIAAAATVTKADNGTATWTFDGSGTNTWTDSSGSGGQDLGLVSINGSTKTINLGSSVKSTTLTIAASQTFGLASSGYVFTLTGSGTAASKPFQNSGTLNEGTNSTFKYTGTADTDIDPETYFHLTIAPNGGAGPTYTLDPDFTSNPMNVSGDFVLGDSTNAVTLTMTDFCALVVSGNYTVNANGTVNTPTDAQPQIGGSYLNNGTLNDVGTGFEFTSTSTGKTIAGNITGANRIRTIIFSGVGGGWSNSSALETDAIAANSGTFSGTNNVTVNGGVSGSAGVISRTGGTFTVTIAFNFQTFGPTTASTAWTFNDLSFSNSGGTQRHADQIACATCTLTVNGNMSLGTDSTLILNNSSWTIVGSLTTTTSGSIIYTGTPTVTVQGTTIGGGSGNIIFYNLTKSGAGTTAWSGTGVNAVRNTLTLSAGTFTAPSGTLIVNDYVESGGSFSHNSGTLLLNPTSNKTLTAASTLNNLTLNDGLVGWWKLDETAGTTSADSSGYGNDGTMTNSPTISTDVPTVNFSNARSLSFNGTSQYVDIGVRPFVDDQFADKITLSVWMKPSSLTGNHVIVGKSYDTNHSSPFYVWNLFQAGDIICFRVDSSSTCSGASTLTTGWQHIVGVYDGSNMYLYRNGTQVNTTLAKTGNVQSSLQKARIAARDTPGAGLSEYYAGNVDDVRIYRRALSTTEVGYLKDGNMWNMSGMTWTMGGAITAAGSVTLPSGTLDTSNGNNYGLTVGGSWLNDGGVFTARSGTVTMNAGASGKSVRTGQQSFNNLTFNNASGGWTMTEDDTANANTIGGNLTVTAGSLTALSSGTINLSGNYSNAGTFVHNNGTLKLNGTTSTTLDSGCSSIASVCSNQDLYNLTLNKTSATDANDNVTLSSTHLWVANTLTITDGELIQGTLDVAAAGSTAVSIASGSDKKWTNISTGDLKLGGTFTNAGTAVFNSNNGTQCSDTADDIVITSTVGGTQRLWTNTGTLTIYNVNATDMTNSSITAYTSTLSNTTWTVGACGITFSGTVFQSSNEASAFDCTTSSGSQLDLVVAVNGDSTPDTGTCTSGVGTFSFTVTDPGAADVPIVLYVANTESEKATTVTLSASGGSTISGISLMLDRVVISQQSATATTNTHLNNGDNGNSGIRYNVSAGALTVDTGMELHVLSGKTFTPGGAVTTTATGTAAGAAGDLHIAGTLTMGTNNLTVGGDYNNAGTFNKTNTQTTTLAATGTGFTITPGTGDFNNLTVSGNAGGNGTYTLSGADLTVDGVLDVNTGDTLTIGSGRVLTNSGTTDASISGTIDGAGTLRFTSSSTGGPGTTGTISSIVRYDASGASIPAAVIDTRTYGGDLEFYSNVAAIRSWTPFSGTINVTGNFKIISGASQSSVPTFAGNTNNPALNITGSISITKSGSATPALTTGSGVWTVTGDVNLTNSTFTASTGNEIAMNGTSKSLTFVSGALYKLTIAGTIATTNNGSVNNVLTVNASKTLTISGVLTSGSAGSVVIGASGTITGGSLKVQNSNLEPTNGTINSYVYLDTTLGSITAPSRSYGNGVSIFQVSNTNHTVTPTAGTFSVALSLDIDNSGDSSTGSVTFDASAFNPTVTIGGSVAGVNYTGLEKEIIIMGSGTWTVSGSFDMSSIQTLTSGTSTLLLNGTGTLTTNGFTLNNLQINSSGTVTLAAATHAVAGSLLLGGSGTPSVTGSTINMTGSSKTITGGGKTINSLTISDNTTVQTSDLTVSGTLTIAASKTLTVTTVTLTDSGTAEVTWGNSSSSIAGTGTLTFPNGSGGPGTGGSIDVATRFDATNGNVASTTIDGRTYNARVEMYSNSTSSRTLTLSATALVTSGASSHFHVIAANSGNVIVDGSANPNVTIAGDLDFTGTGNGIEVISAGSGTWTVSGNVDFTKGIYGPLVSVLNPSFSNTARKDTFIDPNNACGVPTVTYSCLGSGTVQWGNTHVGDCINNFENENDDTDRGWMQYDLSGITNGVTVLTAQIGTTMQTTATGLTTVARSSQDDLNAQNCTISSGTFAQINNGTYGTTDLTGSGNNIIWLGAIGASDVQARMATTDKISIGLKDDTDTAVPSVSSAPLFVGYYSSGSPTLVLNGTSKTLTSAGNSFYNLTLSGSITLANATHIVGNNLDMTGGTITPGTSQITMTGTSGTLSGPASGSLYGLTIDPSSNGTITLATGGSDLTVGNLLTIGSSNDGNNDTLSIGANRTITLSPTSGTALVFNDTSGGTNTISGSGRLTYKTSASFPSTGTISSIVRFDATGATSQTIASRTYGGPVEIYNSGGTSKTVASNSGTMVFNSTLDLSRADTATVTLDLNTVDPTTTTVSGALTIGAGTTLSAPSTNAMNVNSNYTNSGTFTHNSGTVTLAGGSQQTLSGTMTGTGAKFNALTISNASGSDPESSPSVIFSASAESAATTTVSTASVKVRFNAGSTYTFQNISFNGGAVGTRVALRSSTIGTQWNLNVAGTRSVSNTDVRDSNACGQAPDIDATDGTNLDRGNNSCWSINTMTFSVSDNTIGFGSCSASAARYATGDTTGAGTDTADAHTLSVTTNAGSGYSLTVLGPTLTSGGNTITALGGTATASSAGSEQFGIRAIKNSGSGTVSTPFDTSNWAYGATSSAQQIASYTGSNSSYSAVYGVRYLCNISSTTEAGSYAANVTYIATGTF